MSYRGALVGLATTSGRGMRLGLATTRALLDALGNPQAGLPGVLVAGTNGKGSVSAMVAEMASRSGHRVALLTKPHLTSYRERIQLAGEPVSEALFASLAERSLAAASAMDGSAGGPTHHELLTAMGFLAAADWGADVTVCEVGLGGRLDASNVWDGGVAVLTSVGLDHQAQLGNTVAEIAGEKAAIIKPGDLAVSGADGDAREVVQRASAAVGARLWQLGEEIQVQLRSRSPGLRVDLTTPTRSLTDVHLGVEGAFQAANAALAVASADCLCERGFEISDGAVRQGLESVRWPGRLQSLGGEPEVVVDAAHNPAAVEAILPDLRARSRGRRTVLLFGSMRDHDHRGMLELLAGLDLPLAVLTRADSRRAEAPSLLRAEWSGVAELVEPSSSALDWARRAAGPGGQVLVLGSIYVVGEVMATLGVGLPPDPEVPEAPLW